MNSVLERARFWFYSQGYWHCLLVGEMVRDPALGLPPRRPQTLSTSSTGAKPPAKRNPGSPDVASAGTVGTIMVMGKPRFPSSKYMLGPRYSQNLSLSS